MDGLPNCSNVNTMICLCSGSEVGIVFLLGWFVSYVLLVPVFVYVLYLGHRKWKKHPCSVSHSDVFTFHMVGVELLSVLGSIFLSCGLFVRIRIVIITGMSLCSLAFTAQLFFHCLTCLERYLAVVHPITYLRLKKSGGVTIRNVSVTFVWLVFLSDLLLTIYSLQLLNFVHLSQVILSLTLTSFCSVSVLCVLIRPGPGERGITKKQLNHSKKSAFYTIMVILAVLVTRLVNSMVYQIMFMFNSLKLCLMVTFTHLPSSLVLPLLFLHRERTRQ